VDPIADPGRLGEEIVAGLDEEPAGRGISALSPTSRNAVLEEASSVSGPPIRSLSMTGTTGTTVTAKGSVDT